MGVQELSKAPNEPCEHDKGRSCGIYGTRPAGCRSFNCLWRFGLLDPEDRPDKSGVVFDMTEPSGQLGSALVARPAWPGALDAAGPIFDRLAQEGHLVILVYPEGRRSLIGPPDRVAEVSNNIALHEIEGQDGRCTDEG